METACKSRRASDPFTGSLSIASLKEIRAEDDLFSTYIDIKKISGEGGASNDSVHTGTSGKNEEDKRPGGSGSGSISIERLQWLALVQGRAQETKPSPSFSFDLSSAGSAFLLVGVGPQPSLVAKSFSI
ncbi:hypothetical protein PIB30_021860 [Stylosanthes scabra]|uniref:Uncharacterized protein n=1 Tax=Stylosanthes scabra TaxID=79078 RepID=A0ABU6Q8Q0_9FABA|nr:hypothetical protein [Stylosanthes scabra]